ncbi:hypothetical protein BT67DRAFT_445437 [Trichocladium antarcticum]|uniref:Uncharacterized protein n=1 Tax=Trichocladium antarcticum TaxID=1450529 RepID=A0AAN6Z9C7_9PEZI|nr:hypothetical protein BT67DRAFT_445437 [Trichocladium antarcticum]
MHTNNFGFCLTLRSALCWLAGAAKGARDGFIKQPLLEALQCPLHTRMAGLSSGPVTDAPQTELNLDAEPWMCEPKPGGRPKLKTQWKAAERKMGIAKDVFGWHCLYNSANARPVQRRRGEVVSCL